MNLTNEQDRALKAILRWARDPSQPVFALGGYAGTGKSTLMELVARELRPDFVGPTAKSVAVLRSKLPAGAPACTAHSYLYSPVEYTEDDRDRQAEVVRRLVEREAPREAIRSARRRLSELTRELERGGCDFVRRAGGVVPFVACDEASMIDRRLRDDLVRRARKVLFVGDPGQLRPVRGRGFFEEIPPHAMLEEVHRQARDSRVLRMATALRRGDRWSDWGDGCELVRGFPGAGPLLEADQVVAGMNKTRRRFNALARRHLGHSGPPRAGERLMCLRNSYQLRLYNGVAGLAASDGVWGPGGVWIDLEYGGELHDQLVLDDFHFRRYDMPSLDRRSRPYHGQPEFDFGYAITCHKAQGSEWPWVVVLDDDFNAHDADFRRRWAYTAVTRASERITWVRR